MTALPNRPYTREDIWYNNSTGAPRAAWLQSVDPSILAPRLVAVLENVSQSLELWAVQNSDHPLHVDLCLQEIADVWREFGRHDRDYFDESE
jgi:hypothetical protein